ncbi:hypothetical protein XENTR_v10018029 [Xenopus tropicalis]|nr:hypothetical protein XENTR_v10018029 [Xenopus tropicalis]
MLNSLCYQKERRLCPWDKPGANNEQEALMMITAIRYFHSTIAARQAHTHLPLEQGTGCTASMGGSIEGGAVTAAPRAPNARPCWKGTKRKRIPPPAQCHLPPPPLPAVLPQRGPQARRVSALYLLQDPFVLGHSLQAPAALRHLARKGGRPGYR